MPRPVRCGSNLRASSRRALRPHVASPKQTRRDTPASRKTQPRAPRRTSTDSREGRDSNDSQKSALGPRKANAMCVQAEPRPRGEECSGLRSASRASTPFPSHARAQAEFIKEEMQLTVLKWQGKPIDVQERPSRDLAAISPRSRRDIKRRNPMTLARYLRCIPAASPLCLRCISAGAEIDDPQGCRGCAGSGRQHSAGPPRCRRDVAEISPRYRAEQQSAQRSRRPAVGRRGGQRSRRCSRRARG